VRAYHLVAWQKPVVFRDVPSLESGPGEVLVKVRGAGACHSDLHLMEAPAPPQPIKLPFTLGHENAGWVEKLGPGVTGLAPGDPA
jgi:alcohol dehydrogenase, propanol-preferring